MTKTPLIFYLYTAQLMLVISLEKKYVHVRQRARNVHLKIYDMQEMYVHVTCRTNK